MTNLMKFENCNVQIIKESNGTLLFELYLTGKALGYYRWNGKRTSCTPHKERINKVVENAEIVPVVRNGQQYLTESQLFDFMLEAKTEKVKPFRKWVTQEVLPSINHTGSYSIEQKQEPPYEYFDQMKKIPITLDFLLGQ